MRLAVLPEIELFGNLFGQVPMTAFGEDGTLGVQFHAALKVVLRRAILSDTDVVGGNSLYGAILVIKNLRGTVARIHLYACGFRLLAEPRHYVTQSEMTKYNFSTKLRIYTNAISYTHLTT